jgi:hypothetical protein
VENGGASLVFISAPLFSADQPSADTQHYDAVLDAQAEWLRSQAKDGWQVIDIRPDLRASVAAAKIKNPAFVYAGDRIHPGPEGHDFIAASVARKLWPLWMLPGAPAMPEGQALAILSKRNGILNHAWLTQTRHLRPGVPAGLPMDAARAQAEELLHQYRSTVVLEVSP